MKAARKSSGPVAANGIPDAPTDGDRRRIRHARRVARARLRGIDAARDAAMVEAFREEIGLAVRSASPILMSLLALEDRTLDDAVESLEPRSGWPSRPRLSGPRTARSLHVHLLRHYVVARYSQFARRPPTPITERPLVSRTFVLAGGGHLELQVVDHSLEIEARLGPAWIETRFGELSIQLDFELPATVFAACVGRLVEEIVDHGAWRGRGWRIVAIVEADFPWGQRLIVTTGSVPYRMPWAR